MFDPADALTTGFVVLLLAVFVTQSGLTLRQIRHVAANRLILPAAFRGVIALSDHQKAADYTVAKARLTFIESAVGTVVLLGWTLLGGLNQLNHWMLGALGPGFVPQLALLTAFATMGALIDLPLSWYRTFVIEERFGFNNTTPATWVTDGLKGAAVAAVLGLPLASILLWLMGAGGEVWWLWAWGVYLMFSILMMWAFPAFIAPLFNTFSPLQDTHLQQRAGALMARCGFEASGFYVMDGSKRSAHANAYFTGLGKVKRVVFFDTLLTHLTPGELEAVLAHELGHFHHKHLRKRLWGVAGLSFVLFCLMGWLSSRSWFYTGLGVEPPMVEGHSALALLLFALTVPLVLFFFTPLMAVASRRDEFEADRYAAQQTSRSDLASALTKLYKGNATTLTPDPWYVAFYHSHPPAQHRLVRLTP